MFKSMVLLEENGSLLVTLFSVPDGSQLCGLTETPVGNLSLLFSNE